MTNKDRGIAVFILPERKLLKNEEKETFGLIKIKIMLNSATDRNLHSLVSCQVEAYCNLVKLRRTATLSS